MKIASSKREVRVIEGSSYRESTVVNIPYLIAFSSTATSAGKAAETKTNDILAMISPEGERVGLTKVINIIISFFVNEKTLCCPF